MKSIAFITPSYGPDLGRCEILVESVRRFAADVNHYIVVDRQDRSIFAHLAGPRTIIVPSEEVLHPAFHRIPGRKGVWLSFRALPLRGWMAQQLMKLGAPGYAGEDVFVCLDSDMAFVRPFQADHLLERGRLGLLDVDYAGGLVPTWTEVAADLLGLPRTDCPPRGHVGEMIVWTREHLLQLHSRMETVKSLPWQIAIARKRTFSEYVLYGTFVRCALGYPRSAHVPSVQPLVRQPWAHDFSTPEGIRDFIGNIEPGNIAVMIHSKYDLTAADLRPHFEHAWNAYDGS